MNINSMLLSKKKNLLVKLEEIYKDHNNISKIDKPSRLVGFIQTGTCLFDI